MSLTIYYSGVGGVALRHDLEDVQYSPGTPCTPKLIFIGDNLNKVKSTSSWGPDTKIDVFQVAAVVQEVHADPAIHPDEPEIALKDLTCELLLSN